MGASSQFSTSLRRLLVASAAMCALATSNAQAGKVSRLTCSLRYTNLPILEDKILTAAERELLAKIYSDSSITPSERVKKAREVLLEARLRALHPETAQFIRAQWDGLVRVTEGRIRESHYQSSVKVSISKDLMDTFVENAVLFHEVEHLIQRDEMLRTDPKAVERLFMKLDRIPPIRYEKEIGAMGMEGLSYQVVPKEIRKDLLHEITRGSLRNALNQEDREFLKRVLTHSFLELKEFISAEQGPRNYSLQILQLKYQLEHWDGLLMGAYSAKDKAELGVFTGAISAIVVGGLYATCYELMDTRHVKTLLYKHVCAKLGFSEKKPGSGW